MPQKLGIKPGTRLYVLGAPWDYAATVGPLPAGVTISTRIGQDARFIHLFVRSARELEDRLPRLERSLADDGMLWISWPKKSSGIATDISEDTLREVALPLGLVDVKVCAVDGVWSGLKVVRRVEERGKKA